MQIFDFVGLTPLYHCANILFESIRLFRVHGCSHVLDLCFFCTDFLAKLRVATFNGLYLHNQKAQTAKIKSVCCPSAVELIACMRSHAPPFMWEGPPLPQKSGKKIKFRKLSRVWRPLGKSFKGFAPGLVCFRGAQCLPSKLNQAGLHKTVSPPEGAVRTPIQKFTPTREYETDPNFQIHQK